MLSDSESETESGPQDIQFTINEHFAKAYAAKKEREELDKLKEKYGSDPDEAESEEDSEDVESEDEDGEQLTPAMDAAILRTLAKIKRKDPEIYDKNKSILEQEQERIAQTAHRSKSRDQKPITIKQHALSSMLNGTSRSPSPEPQIVTHDQEQLKLRSETISAFHQAVDQNDDDALFLLREKTKDEIEREEEEYQEYLKREVGVDIKDLVTIEGGSLALVRHEDSEEAAEVASKTKKKRMPNKSKEEKPETDQEFLMNYILNRGWIDRSTKRVPTYKDITKRGMSEPEDASNDAVPDAAEHEGSLDEEEEFEDIVDRFESSYNFRFEEPGAAVIPTHPRNLDSIARRPDNTRKEARERRKQRKEEERNKKKEEVKRLKALKMKELRRKLEQIGREGGVEIDTEGFVDFDLDGDWDPEKHDRQMVELYDEGYEEDVKKPQWAGDIDVDDILSATPRPSESKSSKKKKRKHQTDEAFPDGVDVDAMDADAPRTLDEEEWDGTEEMRKRKVHEYMDEVYGMDFNDMVGDMPTRFKYTSVAPQSYALTPAEILLATDAELNEYMGIKRIAPYRKDGRWDVKRADRLRELKAKLKERSWWPGQTNSDGVDGGKSKKRKGKKERQRAKVLGEEEGPKLSETDLPSQPPAKKRRKG